MTMQENPISYSGPHSLEGDPTLFQECLSTIDLAHKANQIRIPHQREVRESFREIRYSEMENRIRMADDIINQIADIDNE